MRLSEYARLRGLTSKEVSAAARELKFDSSHSSSTIDREERDLLDDYFGKRKPQGSERKRSAPAGDSGSGDAAATNDSAALPGGDLQITAPSPYQNKMIQLPPLISPPGKYYCPRHIELRLSAIQVQTLQQLMYSLQCDGVDIQRAPDVFRWLLDQAAV